MGSHARRRGCSAVVFIHSQDLKILKIMAVFNWNYLSFVNFDSTWVYREMVLIPILIVILWFVWMKVVRSALKDALNTTRAMSVDEAYANAAINDALSTDDEADEGTAEGSASPSKSDLNAEEAEDNKKDL